MGTVLYPFIFMALFIIDGKRDLHQFHFTNYEECRLAEPLIKAHVQTLLVEGTLEFTKCENIMLHYRPDGHFEKPAGPYTKPEPDYAY